MIIRKLNPLRTVLIIAGITYVMRANHLRRNLESKNTQLVQFGSFQFYSFAFMSLALSCFAGVCSGLTAGFMSISNSEMESWEKSDDPQKRKIATTLLDILSNHNSLLSTLIFFNALCLVALPIFLDRIVPSYMAIFISTAAAVILGEAFPQAYCTGQNKISTCYFFSPFVRFLQCFLCPIVKPIVLLLDAIVEQNEKGIVLTHDKIKSLLLLHNKKQYGYRPQEIQILQNCLDLRNFHVNQVMIPLQKVFMLEANQKLDEALVNKLVSHNYSKFLIYEKTRDNIIGFVKSKKLMIFDIQNPTSFKQSNVIIPVLQISIQQTLLDTIDILRSEKINFAVVVNENKKCLGIVTLKQLFQKIVLKKFKDDDIRVHIHLNKHVRINHVVQSKQQH